MSDWRNLSYTAVGQTPAQSYTCPWCQKGVTSVEGLFNGQPGLDRLQFCPGCTRPTFIAATGETIPGLGYGDHVEELSDNVARLYDEARRCLSVNASHAAVLLARKLLMHVAVDQGAEENKSFAHYVNYLVSQNLIPPGTKDWVDEVRELGNDATHEIKEFSLNEAKAAIDFVSMLLKLLYEYPARGAKSVAARNAVPPTV